MGSRVLLLVGGGLDSALARAWLARRGVVAECVHFATGFVRDGRATFAAASGVETIDVAADYLREVVRAPRHGYGAGLNACRDCRIFLLRRADAVARARGIDVLATGDVLGQRALDQSRCALRTIDREAGVAGRVLRPLSAALLEPLADAAVSGALGTPLGLHGRARREQLALARELGIPAAPAPGGGCCRLAERSFARRLRDLLEHASASDVDGESVARLRRGRHYRLDWRTKLVVGRDAAECAWLEAHAGSAWVGRPATGPGPLALLDGEPDGVPAARAAAILARHARRAGGTALEVVFRRAGEERRVRAVPAAGAQLAEHVL